MRTTSQTPPPPPRTSNNLRLQSTADESFSSNGMNTNAVDVDPKPQSKHILRKITKSLRLKKKQNRHSSTNPDTDDETDTVCTSTTHLTNSVIKYTSPTNKSFSRSPRSPSNKSVSPRHRHGAHSSKSQKGFQKIKKKNSRSVSPTKRVGLGRERHHNHYATKASPRGRSQQSPRARAQQHKMKKMIANPDDNASLPSIFGDDSNLSADINHLLTYTTSDGGGRNHIPPAPPRRRRRNAHEMDGFCRFVDFYDGHVLTVDGIEEYELGNYLGGGVAGVVYGAIRVRPQEDINIFPLDPTKPKNPLSNMPSTPGYMADENLAIELHSQNNTNDNPNDDGGSVCTTVLDAMDTPSRSKLQIKSAMSSSSFSIEGKGSLGQEETVAVKILNPIGFRLLPSSAIGKDIIVVQQGKEMSEAIQNQLKPMTEEHVWWMINPNSRNLRTLQKHVLNEDEIRSVGSTTTIDRGEEGRGIRLSLIAGYMCPKAGELRELPLGRCVEIWGMVPFGASEEEFEGIMNAIEKVNTGQCNNNDLTQDVVANKSTDSPVTVTEIPSNLTTGIGELQNVTGNAKMGLTQYSSSGQGQCHRANCSVYCETLKAHIVVPKVPPKYLRWLRQRRAVTKEMRHMMHIGRHKNVVNLYEVLELIQDSKSTMFLVLELVTGGELFDLISSPDLGGKDGNEADMEEMMRKFFTELASGINYCHQNGIAHRDLKPENLLVHNGADGKCTLKIADFGLSATFENTHNSENKKGLVEVNNSAKGSMNLFGYILKDPASVFASYLSCGNFGCNPGQVENLAREELLMNINSAEPMRRMTSIVGSPHYVAPEVVSQASNREDANKNQQVGVGGDIVTGYDGTKADVWSAGVILYAMLFRSLPFGEDLLACPRYVSYTQWYEEAAAVPGSRRSSGYAALNPNYLDDIDAEEMMGPHWFYPTKTSIESRDMIVAMLNPDPEQRLSIAMVERHPWLAKKNNG